jgi:hypothetical protein
MQFTRLIIAGAALAAAASAKAVVVVGAVTGGSAGGNLVILDTPPAQVGNNRQQSNDTFVWNELQSFLLTADLQTNLGLDPIPAGTLISSHGFVFDPRPDVGSEGFVTFDRPILAVITLRNELRDSDFLNPATAFDNPLLRGIEPGDTVTFSGNTLRWNLTASNPGDNIRIITAAIPEPATWAMMIAGFGMVGFAARRRRVTTNA